MTKKAGFISPQELREMVSYDPNTGEFRWRPPFGSRRPTSSKLAFGWQEDNGYMRGYIKGRRVNLHRLAWFYHYGKWPAQFLDHINGVRSDNRIANLREATASQNQWNKRPAKKLGSRFKGVTKSACGSTYEAKIRVDGKYKYLGCFKTREAAGLAYQLAADAIHGDFAFHKRGEFQP